jgi:Na+/H+ antiporter NhaA
LENRLLPWTSFLIVPLFALANSGVDFREVNLVEAATSPVALGISLGLVIGKTIGITLFAWLGVITGLGRLPAATTWRQLVGLAALGGIGFTVSLFVTNLAFEEENLADFARVGIFAGSLLAGILGSLILLRTTKRRSETPE